MNHTKSNPHFAICIGRQLGSGGYVIGQKIAQELGFKFYDSELIYAAADRSGYSKDLFEKSDEERSAIRSFFTNCFPFLGNADFYGNPVNEEALFSILSQTIQELSEQENCLFVGRCAEYILRHHPNMTSIFISANMPDRIKRIAEKRGVSEERAKHLAHHNDKSRATFHDFYSNNQWGHAATYNLCINSSVLGIDATTELIINFIKQRFNL